MKKRGKAPPSLSPCHLVTLSSSQPILQPLHARLLGAVVAAVKCTLRLQPVADDAAAAVLAAWGEFLDGTLEAVEGVGLAVLDDLEGLVVIVSAGIAAGHN